LLAPLSKAVITAASFSSEAPQSAPRQRAFKRRTENLEGVADEPPALTESRLGANLCNRVHCYIGMVAERLRPFCG